MLDIIYAEEIIRARSQIRTIETRRRFRPDPKAEVPRTGVGLVHEVFRRIAEGERPLRAEPRRWRLSFDGRR